MHVCELYIYFCDRDPGESSKKLSRNRSLPGVALDKLASWQFTVAYLPRATLDKEMTEPGDVRITLYCWVVLFGSRQRLCQVPVF